jgi:hypothetical protein
MTKQTMTDTDMLDFVQENVCRIRQLLDTSYEVAYMDSEGNVKKMIGEDLRDCIMEINNLETC